MVVMLDDSESREPVMGGVPFTRSMATKHGFSSRRLDQLLDEGSVLRPMNDVYISADVADSLEARAAAVALVMPAAAAVSGLTAAWLLGVDARSPDQLRHPCPLECTVDVGCEPMSRPGLGCRVAPLSALEIAVVHDVPCTTPLRTTIDLLRRGRPHMALGAADAMAHKGLIDVTELTFEVERWAGYRGVVQARRLAALVEPRTESFGESWCRLRIIDSGFPRPQVQIWVRDAAGRQVYRLDMGWEELRKAVEYDGLEHHSSRRDQDHDDDRRDELRTLHGWDVVPAQRGDILGRSMTFERAVGELLSMEPQIFSRTW